MLCFVVVMQSFIMNSHEIFIHIHQGCFAGTGAIVRLPQCQWSKPDGSGKISLCITTTKHSKAKTVCIFLGIYCMSHRHYRLCDYSTERRGFCCRQLRTTSNESNVYCFARWACHELGWSLYDLDLRKQSKQWIDCINHSASMHEKYISHLQWIPHW